ncbi:MAG: twin-arginine translocation signal domain-containing protein [Gemmatimonadetes bacterium]|nr:twin-arginine translocation signal domain-containing protein [Gemmatimonadota bacterium]
MDTRSGGNASWRMSRRRFLRAVGAAGTLTGAALLPSRVGGQAPKATKDSLRPVVDANSLAITDQQLEKLAPAVDWGLGEMRKLREVDVGLGGPAPVFLPAVPDPRGGNGHE